MTFIERPRQQKETSRTIDTLVGDQRIVAHDIRHVVTSTFSPEDQPITVGFGSFWQNPSRLKPTSDCDFFVLVPQYPSVIAIQTLNQNIQKEVGSKIPYKVSPQIFAGTIDDVSSGADNMLRIFTILDPEVDLPVIITGPSSVNLLDGIVADNLPKQFKEATFTIGRHLTHGISEFLLTNDGNIPEGFIRSQQSRIARYVRAHTVAEHYFSIPGGEAYQQIAGILGQPQDIDSLLRIQNHLAAMATAEQQEKHS